MMEKRTSMLMTLTKWILIALLSLPFILFALLLSSSLKKYINKVNRREREVRKIAEEEIVNIKTGKIDYFSKRYGNIGNKGRKK